MHILAAVANSRQHRRIKRNADCLVHALEDKIGSLKTFKFTSSNLRTNECVKEAVKEGGERHHQQ